MASIGLIQKKALPALTLILVGAFTWAALYASLEKGRTTPLTASLSWLTTFSAVLAVSIAWFALYWFLLRLVSGGKSRSPLRVSALAIIPLFLSMPFLLVLYGSDALNHYLLIKPVARLWLCWAPVAITLAWQLALFVCTAHLPVAVLHALHLERSVPILLFLSFASLYLFSAGGHLYSPDEKGVYQITESIVQGTLATTYDPTIPQEVDDHLRWSAYGLVPSLLGVPPYWLSSVLGVQLDPPSPAFPIPNVAYPLVDLMVSPLATAATCALLYAVARRLGYRAITSLVLAVAYGLGTSAWVYAKAFFPQPAAALFLLAATYYLLRREEPDPFGFTVAGLMLGLGVGTRFELPLLAFPIGLLVLRGFTRDTRTWLLCAFLFALAFAAATMATAGWYNWVKTGSIIDTGHGAQTGELGFGVKPYIGLFGTFFSSGFGLFTFNPITMLGLFSLLFLAIKRPVEAAVFGSIVVAAALFYGTFDYWRGGFTWANRYLVVVLPFAILPVGVLLERPWRTPISIMLVAGSVLLGSAINVLGVLFDWNLGWLDLWSHNASITQIEFDPHFSTIGAHLRLLGEFLSNGSKLDLYLYYKLGLPSLIVFPGGFVALLALALRAARLQDDVESMPAPGWSPVTRNV